MSFWFVLPSVSVGVDETIETLKDETKIAGWSVLLNKGDVVRNSVSI